MATPRAAQKRKPAPAPPETSIPPKDEESEWATADMLSDERMFEDVTLINGKKVRVRYLDTLEVASLQVLPDYAGYVTLAVRLRELLDQNKDDDSPFLPKDFDSGKATLETVKYQVHVIHRAVVDPLHPGDVRCEDCQGDTHPRSLWTRKEVARLPAQEIERLASVALRAGEVVSRVPFSKAATPNDSSQPASTGDSTQPTNS